MNGPPPLSRHRNIQTYNSACFRVPLRGSEGPRSAYTATRHLLLLCPTICLQSHTYAIHRTIANKMNNLFHRPFVSSTPMKPSRFLLCAVCSCCRRSIRCRLTPNALQAAKPPSPALAPLPHRPRASRATTAEAAAAVSGSFRSSLTSCTVCSPSTWRRNSATPTSAFAMLLLSAP